jgi:uncharacterized protein (UPF0303 family)
LVKTTAPQAPATVKGRAGRGVEALVSLGPTGEDGMDIAELEAEEGRLVLDQFGAEEAWRLGTALVEMARAGGLKVAIAIRTPDRTYFHASLPGALPQNDNWARRKSNTALYFQAPSMLVTLRARARGRSDLSNEGLPAADYALSGGAVPIRVKGTGVVAVVVVSGLPEEEDHSLAVRGIEALR